jgi:hypothetical protein
LKNLELLQNERFRREIIDQQTVQRLGIEGLLAQERFFSGEAR